MNWTPDRATALETLKDFLPRAKSYARERNFDRGSEDRSNVSLLSPFLRHRLITEREVWDTTLAHHSFSTVEKFLQEVVWRTYWKGWLERRPGVWDEWCQGLGNSAETPGLARAIAGQTGIEPFDAWTRELIAHNYLHNHARMWFASIWIFTLRLPWEAGAAFFLEHLLDGDPASNTLGWRWVAGLQTQGKHYLANADNIRRFTDGRLDPGNRLNEDASPPPPGDPPKKVEAGLPPVVVDDPPTAGDGLLLTSDDLAPETLFEDAVFEAVAGGRPEEADPEGLREAEAVSAFRREAIRSALGGIRDRQGREGHWLPEADAETVRAWAKENQIRRLWMVHAPVGPTRHPTMKIASELESAGITVRRYAREWDHQLHPFAESGFFAFRKKAFPALHPQGGSQHSSRE